LDRNDQFGVPYNMTMFGGPTAKVNKYLSLHFRPCVPVQITEANRETVKCGVKDINDKAELQRKLDDAKEYVGNAIVTALFSTETFMVNEYNEKRIKRSSKI
jgi:hypothetical protein